MNPATARLILDPGAMGEVLAAVPGLLDGSLGSVELAGTWIKPGRYFNAHYRLVDEAGEVVDLSAFVVNEKRAAQIAKTARAHGDHSDRRQVCAKCRTHRAAPDIVLQVFPVDYRLPTLPDCLSLDRVNDCATGSAGFAGREVVAYRPGMRCQIRYRDQDGRSTFGKVAVEKDTPGTVFDLQRDVYAALSSDERRFVVPRPLEYVAELRLGLVEGLAGESYFDIIRRGQRVDSETACVADALYDFHRVDIASAQRHYRVDDELDLVDTWVKLVSGVYPELAEGLGGLHAAVCASRPQTRGPRAVFHRDFYDKQVLLSCPRPALLDMDTTCRGDSELDLGNFAAHLWLRGLQWDQAERYRELEGLFLDAYEGDVDAGRLRWYRKATLLRLACVYALRPAWKHLTEAVVDEACKS
ncbi:MAG: hypothetical protein ACE5D3_08895 [Candidatus Binatia bacterium]